MKEVWLFCDGACKGNPGVGGWGAIILEHPHEKEKSYVRDFGGHEPHSTNNAMELEAAIQGLSEILATDRLRTKITVFTDSSYVVNGVSKWVFGWRKKEWLTQEGKPVSNKDRWEKLYKLAHTSFEEKPLFKLLPGHAGIMGNERADKIASDCALGLSPQLYRGPAKAISYDMTILEPGKKYPFYMSFIDGKLAQYEKWEDCQRAVTGQAGAFFKKIKNPLDEADFLEKTEAILADFIFK